MKWFHKKHKDNQNRIVVKHSKDDIRVYRTPSSLLNMNIKQERSDVKTTIKEYK